MSSMNQLWKRLDYDDPRDPNVSSQVCPLVSEQNLESMHKSQQFDLEHSTLPDGNVYMGVPGGAQMWQLRGEVLGYSREVLTIYLAPEFCLADYSHLN